MRDTTKHETRSAPPAGVKVLSVILLLFGLMAFFGSLFLWGQGFLLDPPEGVDLSFPIADILINAPASIIAAVGLWRMKRYGYLASQFVAGFYIYASVEIFVDLCQHGAASTAEYWAILIPQVFAVLVAGLLIAYLWTLQDRFFKQSPH
jgi:hypothetical protein